VTVVTYLRLGSNDKPKSGRQLGPTVKTPGASVGGGQS